MIGAKRPESLYHKGGESSEFEFNGTYDARK